MAENNRPITESRFGKLTVIVEPVFSKSTTDTVVDKVRKIILQHAFDPEIPEEKLGK